MQAIRRWSFGKVHAMSMEFTAYVSTRCGIAFPTTKTRLVNDEVTCTKCLKDSR